MTNRINSFVVVLDADYRDDDLEHITNALRMVKNVVQVVPHVADISDHVATERARRTITLKLLDLVKQLNNNESWEL